MFALLNEINKILGIQSTIEQLVLCRKCYNDTYTTISTTRASCNSCGATPKTGKLSAIIALMQKQCQNIYRILLGRLYKLV